MGSELTKRVMAYLRAKLLTEAELEAAFGDRDGEEGEVAARAQTLLENVPSMGNEEAIAAMLDFLEQFEEL